VSETLIQTNGICKSFGKYTAVSDLDITVEQGDIYALVGQNGAGKTTLLKMICGLTPPTSGSLALLGHTSHRGVSQARSTMGSIIETPGFLPYLSAKSNLEYYCIQRGIKDRGCIEKTLHTVGLDDTGSKKFNGFSLGMKQRLGLALAILNQPRILILDEPINGLDPMGIAEFRDILLKLNHEEQITILISSHILGELSQMATTYGFIRSGRVIEHISAPELMEKCRIFLKLEVDNTQKAAEILRKTFCENFQIIDSHNIQIGENLEHPELLVKTLVENGVMLSQVYRAGISLEKYFIDLIGGSKIA
jgi:ABC-2 type transport system ATP-binding protein